MDKKQKRTLIIAGIVESAIIIFCLVVSILVLTTFISQEQTPDWVQANLTQNGPFIGWFQTNPTPFFLLIVLPLLVILAIDIIYLIIFAVKKESKLTSDEREEIARKAREEALAELLAEQKAKAGEETPKE